MIFNLDRPLEVSETLGVVTITIPAVEGETKLVVDHPNQPGLYGRIEINYLEGWARLLL